MLFVVCFCFVCVYVCVCVSFHGVSFARVLGYCPLLLVVLLRGVWCVLLVTCCLEFVVGCCVE